MSIRFDCTALGSLYPAGTMTLFFVSDAGKNGKEIVLLNVVTVPEPLGHAPLP